jgi:hypothetical protein
MADKKTAKVIVLKKAIHRAIKSNRPKPVKQSSKKTST